MKKGLMKRWFCVILSFSLVFSMSSMQAFAESAEDANPVIVNPGFETGDGSGNITGWRLITTNTISTVAPSTDFAHSGHTSMHFNNPTNQEQLQVASEKVDVVPGGVYNAKAWAYVVNQSHSVGYEIHFFAADNKPITPSSTFKNFAKGTLTLNDWNELVVPFTVPDNAAKVELRFNSGKTATHTEAYFDDVSIEAVSLPGQPEEPEEPEQPEGPGEPVRNLDFEMEPKASGAIPGWSLKAPTVGVLELATSPVRGGNYSLHFADQSIDSRTQAYSDPLDVNEGDEYVAGAYAYVISQTHSIGLEVHFENDLGTAVGSPTFLNFTAAQLPVKQWSLMEVPFTVPAGATKARLLINSGVPSLTEAYFDDLFITEAGGGTPVDLPNEIQNPGLELPSDTGGIPHWSVGAGTVGVLELSTERVRSGSNSLYFADRDSGQGLRAISDPFRIEGGETYIASAYVNVISQSHNIVLEAYYFDANDVQVGVKTELFSSNSLGTNQWSRMSTQTDVPQHAAYARVALYSGGVSITEAYFDDISFEILPKEEPLDRVYQESVRLGDMVSVNLGQAGQIQTNSLGENEVYFHSNGLPGPFSVLDAETGELKFSQLIPNSEAMWAMTIGSDKNVYFAATGDGLLYRYLPAEKRIESLGVNPADSWVWDLEASSDGKIYGATFQDKGIGKVFEYDIATGTFKNYGGVMSGMDYVRGIAVHGDYIYAALGANVHLFKIHRETGEKTEIPIKGYSGTVGTMADVFVVGNKLFASVSTMNMVVMDLDTYEVLGGFQYSNMLSEPNPHNENEIYYKNGSELFKYDLAQNKSVKIALPFPLPDTLRVKDMTWITLKEGAGAGETVLAMITQYGEYWYYNPKDNSIKFVDLDIASQYVRIQALESGPMDGRIYMGGYQRGMSVYNPFTDEMDVNIAAFAQPEGIGFLNDHVYYGTYVGAVMYKYDPRKPAEIGSNPVLSYDIGHHQDRPFAIASGGGKLYVGTVADYGMLGGVLAVYDERQDKWTQYDDVVEDQAIIGLAYKDGLLYGGTTVWGGLGISPTQQAAKIFVWDVAKGRKVAEFTPDIPGIDETPKMIGDISFGPDGLLWGAVEGTIFAMDVETKEVVKSKMIRPSLYNSSKWKPYHLRWSPDGMLYTTLSRQLTVIDPETLQYKVIDGTFTNDMTIGLDGTIYYAPDAGTALVKIPVPETDATLRSVTVDGKPFAEFSTGVTSYVKELTADSTIEAVPSQQGATIAVEAMNANEKTLIKVTGADGKSRLDYTLYWNEAARQKDRPGAGDPNPPLNPGPPGPSAPVEPETEGRQIVSENELGPNAKGEVAVKLDPSADHALLPINAGELAGNRSIRLDGGNYAVDVPAEVLEQLKQMAEGMAKARIKVTFERASGQDGETLAQAASARYSADVAARSDIRSILLSVVGPEGDEKKLGQFAEPMTLVFDWKGDIDPDATGVYRIDDNGTLFYIGGAIKNGRMVAEATTSGRYAVMQFDKTYSDVPSGHWASRAIKKMTAMLMAQGVSEDRFAPEKVTTRAEFVAFVVRALGLETAEAGSGSFADVASDSWYAAEIEAAFRAGIVNGTSGNTFAPGAAVTREQMAVILYRAYKYKRGNGAVSGSSGSFADQDAVSPWAADAVSAAQTLGLVRGRGNDKFAPQANLTRAEAVQGVLNLFDK